ncbi:uncharacterized protein LOC143025456 isoform X2 [Oratosquilla oratoria]|uniref:uncharacterized protein LOC143025456 isoform X2 n=1 Tax=Oratosquilla oratoria TaxID=337810 RepID=UPI003F758D09
MRMPAALAASVAMLILVQLLQWTSTSVGAASTKRYLLLLAAQRANHRDTSSNWKSVPLKRPRQSRRPRRAQEAPPGDLAGDLRYFPNAGHPLEPFHTRLNPFLDKETEVSNDRTLSSNNHVNCKHNYSGELPPAKNSKHGSSDATNDDVTDRNRVTRRRGRRSSDVIGGGPRAVSRRVRAANETDSTTRSRARRRRGRRRGFRRDKDLALWIDEKQVKLFSGMVMEIYAIHKGRVLPHILDPNFEKHLPVIPSEVETVNFTWKAGHRKYLYDFDQLSTYEPDILNPPVVSVVPRGRVPRKPKVFTVQLPCTGRATGVATFGIGLRLQDATGHAVPGTPLHLTLSKMCRLQEPTRECDRACENGGRCGPAGGCECPEGYMGPYCDTALCYPQCMNGGTCTAPGRCSCPPGFQGRHCEGGICSEKCLNGGKCVQKDTCSCRRGFYGNRCEFSKCVIPCLRGGRCKGVNTCRCPAGYAGHHCEIEVTPPVLDAQGLPGEGAEEGGPGSRNATSEAPDSATARRGKKCSQRCRQGVCAPSGECHCLKGFSGRWCRSRNRKQNGRKSKKGRRSGRRRKIWV